MASKPPLGLRPRYLHDEERLTELRDCIDRHTDGRYPIQLEWVIEYNELVTKYTKHEK